MVLQEHEKFFWKVLKKDVRYLLASLHIALVNSSFILASFNMKPYSHHKMKVLVET